MGKIVIIEEQANKMISKLEKVKDCISEVIDHFSECMDGSGGYQPVGYNSMHYREYNPYAIENRRDDDWDDEYEVKRRRGSRRGYSEMPPKVMRMYDGGGMSRY